MKRNDSPFEKPPASGERFANGGRPRRTLLGKLPARLRRTLYAGFALVTGVPMLWHAFEFLWDRRLFRRARCGTKAQNLGAEEFAELLRAQWSLQVVDVRPRPSYETCRIPGAISVPFISGKLDPEGLAKLDPENPVAVYCDGGFRSRLSLARIREQGFTEIYHLHRGLLAWRLLGMPCVQGSLEQPNSDAAP